MMILPCVQLDEIKRTISRQAVGATPLSTRQKVDNGQMKFFQAEENVPVRSKRKSVGSEVSPIPAKEVVDEMKYVGGKALHNNARGFVPLVEMLDLQIDMSIKNIEERRESDLKQIHEYCTWCSKTSNSSVSPALKALQLMNDKRNKAQDLVYIVFDLLQEAAAPENPMYFENMNTVEHISRKMTFLSSFFGILSSVIHHGVDMSLSYESAGRNDGCSTDYVSSKIVNIILLALEKSLYQPLHTTWSGPMRTNALGLVKSLLEEKTDDIIEPLMPFLESETFLKISKLNNSLAYLSIEIWMLALRHSRMMESLEHECCKLTGTTPTLLHSVSGERLQKPSATKMRNNSTLEKTVHGSLNESTATKVSWAINALLFISSQLSLHDSQTEDALDYWMDASRKAMCIIAEILRCNAKESLQMLLDDAESIRSRIKCGTELLEDGDLHSSLPCRLVKLADAAAGTHTNLDAKYLSPLIPAPWPSGIESEARNKQKIWLKRMRIVQEGLTLLRGLCMHPELGRKVFDALIATAEMQQKTLCIFEKISRTEDVFKEKKAIFTGLPVSLWALAIGTSSRKRSLCPDAVTASRGGCVCCSVQDIIYLSNGLRSRLLIHLGDT